MLMNIRVIPASPGDSILISYAYKGSKKNILIDGGIGETYYGYLSDILHEIKNSGEYIDLLIVTHVDYDHIEGICRWFEDEECDKDIIKQVWFNSGEVISEYFNSHISEELQIKLLNMKDTKQSVSQGITLEKKLNELGCWEKNIISAGKVYNELPGIKITVLSPGIKRLEKLNKKWEVEVDNSTEMGVQVDYNKPIKELLKNKFVQDTSIANGSSIAILLQYETNGNDAVKLEKQYKNIILAADAFPSEIIKTLKEIGYCKEKKLSLELLKVSHHGSKANTNKKFLEIIKCDNFIISSDASTHGLPNKECLARIIDSSNKTTNLYFNYNYVKQKRIFSEDDYKEYKFKCYEMEEGKPYPINKEVVLWI
ncbi:MAG: MBL fold metallo-hydrolase [Cellulosilyticum sp.]|nr:MBL fold metallo-hydrolase [Cellulosilyticum sp.]